MPVAPPTRAATRDALLTRLTDLFLAEGFLGFGVGDLAARLRCSRSTLYAVAPSKEQVVVAAVRHFFRGATERVEAAVAATDDPAERIRVYLDAVAEQLEPASAAFYADLARFAPAGEVYRDNTRWAARRVRTLVAEGVEAGALRPVDAAFVGAAVAEVMTAVQEGRVATATGLDDAAAYRRLADLVLHGLLS